MPCVSYGPSEPDAREVETKLVEQLLLYLLRELGEPAHRELRKMLKEPKHLNANTAVLCATIKGLTPEQTERLVYDGRSKMARKLADWWEHHQEVDRRREEREAHKAAAKALADSARNKLTREELKALLAEEDQ